MTQNNKLTNVAEIALVFVVAFAVIAVGWNIVGDDDFKRQAVVWVGLRLRGQSWEHFGLSFRFAGMRAVGKTVLLSIAVLLAGAAGFVVGSIVAVNVTALRARIMSWLRWSSGPSEWWATTRLCRLGSTAFDQANTR